MTVAAILKELPFFSHLSADQLDQMVAQGRIKAAEAGEVVVREGDAADSMYVILEGEVRVYKSESDADDIEIDIAALTAGSFFGELALLDHGTRSATVACLTPCRFFILNQTGFLNLITISDSAGIHRLFAILARRVRDTSERVFHEELARQTIEARMEIDRLRSLSQMVAGVAHELNTPLGIINTASNMIEKRIGGDVAALLTTDERTAGTYEEVLEASQLIQANITRAHRLVQDFKKISVNQLTDTRENVSLPELVQSIVDLFKINAKQAKLAIAITDKLSDGDRIWAGYPGYLTQVLMNLLSNIERYAYPDGKGGPIEITLSKRSEGKEPYFTLEVSDRGQGIPPEHLERVFEPFFTTGRAKGGTGLGMAIVHNIVTSALHGEVTVESQVGQGTTVTLDLPQTVADAPAAT